MFFGIVNYFYFKVIIDLKDELNIQIAELGFPFPAKIFEKELIESGIQFREMYKSNYEGGGNGFNVYYIGAKDIEKTLLIRDKVEKENEESIQKYRRPIRKKLAYLTLLLIIIFTIYKFIEAFS